MRKKGQVKSARVSETRYLKVMTLMSLGLDLRVYLSVIPAALPHPSSIPDT